jgi:hypothetical protein
MNRVIFSLVVLSVAIARLHGVVEIAVAGPTSAQKCQAAKLKAVSKYDACRLKAEAKAVLKGGSADMSKCDSKIASSWAKAETKGGVDCPTSGDVAPITAEAVSHTDVITAALSGVVCGNGTVEGPEECDTADFAGETCADFGFDSGDLACSGSCTIISSGCFNSCDPLAQACGAGQGCYIFDGGSACAIAGSSTLGASCSFANSCLPGLACADPGGGNECLDICDLSSPSCPIPLSCMSIAFMPYPDVGLCF